MRPHLLLQFVPCGTRTWTLIAIMRQETFRDWSPPAFPSSRVPQNASCYGNVSQTVLMWLFSQVHKCTALGSGWGRELRGAWTLPPRAEAGELLTNSPRSSDSGLGKELGAGGSASGSRLTTV